MEHIKGKISKIEGEKLRELAQDAPGPIVEIGSYMGKSTCYLAQGSKYLVYAIDLWGGEYNDVQTIIRRKKQPHSVFEKFKENISKEGFYKKVIPIKDSSFDIGKIWGIPIGGLFIDGEHTYDACLNDYKNFAPHVMDGGWIAVHDYIDKFPGVMKMCDEEIRPYFRWEVVDRLFIVRKERL